MSCYSNMVKSSRNSEFKYQVHGWQNHRDKFQKFLKHQLLTRTHKPSELSEQL